MSAAATPTAQPRRRGGRALRVVLSCAMSVLFLWITFRGVDWPGLWHELVHVQLGYVGLFVASLLLIQVCRVLRFDLLIRPFARISAASLWRISNVGLLLILVLPLRLGELARPYLLKSESGAPLSAGLGAVAVERAIDGLLVTLLFFATTTYIDNPYHVPAVLMTAAWGSLLLFGAATAVIVGALVSEVWMVRLVERLGRPLSPRLTERVVGMLRAFVTGLRAVPDARALVAFLAWTLLYWTANGLGYWAVMRGFGWQAPPVAGFVLVCVLVLGVMIPAGPGFAGTFQMSLALGLKIFGLNATQAAAYGLVVYPATVACTLAFGVPYLFGGRARVGEIVRASEEANLEAAPPTG